MHRRQTKIDRSINDHAIAIVVELVYHLPAYRMCCARSSSSSSSAGTYPLTHNHQLYKLKCAILEALQCQLSNLADMYRAKVTRSWLPTLDVLPATTMRVLLRLGLPQTTPLMSQSSYHHRPQAIGLFEMLRLLPQ